MELLGAWALETLWRASRGWNGALTFHERSAQEYRMAHPLSARNYHVIVTWKCAFVTCLKHHVRIAWLSEVCSCGLARWRCSRLVSVASVFRKWRRVKQVLCDIRFSSMHVVSEWMSYASWVYVSCDRFGLAVQWSLNAINMFVARLFNYIKMCSHLWPIYAPNILEWRMPRVNICKACFPSYM